MSVLIILHRYITAHVSKYCCIAAYDCLSMYTLQHMFIYALLWLVMTASMWLRSKYGCLHMIPLLHMTFPIGKHDSIPKHITALIHFYCRL